VSAPLRRRLLPALARPAAGGSVRNFWAFFGDFTSFSSGLAFVGASTVLPSLLAKLTSSFPLIGLVDTVHVGAWHLPQLAVAALLAGRPCRRRYAIVPLVASRLVFMVLVPVVLLVPRVDPALELWLIVGGFALFYLADGCGTVAWMDVFSLSLPPAGRSRLLGLVQVVSGVIGAGAGWVVARTLSPAGPAFPLNYALLFGIAAAFMAADVASLASLAEVRDDSRRLAVSAATFLPRLGGLLASDRPYRRMVIVRLLLGFAGMATPFYIVHGLRDLGFDGSVVGLLSAAQIVGGLVAAPAFAALGGWLLQATSYPLLFAAAAAFTLLGVAGSLALPEPRHAITGGHA
jgi:hypothetical protein